MAKMTEKEFINFLEEILMAEEPLIFDQAMPEELFDSTGHLIIVSSFAKEFNITITVNDLLNVKTPKDLYEFIK